MKEIKTFETVIFKDEEILDLAKRVLIEEANSISNQVEYLDSEFVSVVRSIFDNKGHLVVIGMGKSGHVGRKISATFASTGTPSFFINAAEANHGDIGMVNQKDIVLLLSNSGETAEIKYLFPFLDRMSIKKIALTGKADSTLSNFCDLKIIVPIQKEACPLNLAPSSSTTAMMAVGDALAFSVYRLRSFDKLDFALSHPAGALGRRLLLEVRDIMCTGNKIPVVKPDDLLKSAIITISQGGLGFIIIVNEQNTVEGIFTDGDLRRLLADSTDILNDKISKHMIIDFKTTKPGHLASDVLKIMKSEKISGLPVIDDKRRLIGAINFHHLLGIGLE